MRIELIWNGETTSVDLNDGVVTVGGSAKDAISLAGLPHGLLTLSVSGDELRVTAQRSVRIGNTLFPARIPRLLLAGEALKLPNDVVVRRVADTRRLEARKTMGTAFVAQELLAGDLAPQDTQAATFTCVTGVDVGRTFPIPFEMNFIGRADDAAIRLRDRSVSRKHVRLMRQAQDTVVYPVPSAMNGAYVNGRLLKRETTLKTGDIVEVGQTVLRFEDCALAVEPVLARVAAVPVPFAAEPSPVLQGRHPGPNTMANVMTATGLVLLLLGVGVALVA